MYAEVAHSLYDLLFMFTFSGITAGSFCFVYALHLSRVRGQRFTRCERNNIPRKQNAFRPHFKQLSYKATLKLFLVFYSKIDVALNV